MIKRKQRDYTPKPLVSGVLHCEQDHRADVRDLNPERVSVLCSVCGSVTSIVTGLERK
jgi:hypothetical protein